MRGHIVAMGGGGFLGGDLASPLDDLMLELAGWRSRTSCFCRRRQAIRIAPSRPSRAPGGRGRARRMSPSPSAFPTAGGAGRGRDVIVVAGGNTANMLAVWRLHGVDKALRDRWESGAVLGGVSAGANCWFEACVTDSFSIELDGLADGLGILGGSYCPHFDGEERRRPVYARLLAEGFPSGIACDDGAAAVYRGTELVEVVADRPGALGLPRLDLRLRAPRDPPRCDEEDRRHRLGERQRQVDRRPRARGAARRPLRRARCARARPQLDRDARTTSCAGSSSRCSPARAG